MTKDCKGIPISSLTVGNCCGLSELKPIQICY